MKTGVFRHFLHDRRGNLSVMMTLALIPVVGLTGIMVDFTQASRRKATLDSFADAASLAGVTPAMLVQSDQASSDVATTLFNTQASLVPGIGIITLSVNVQDS